MSKDKYTLSNNCQWDLYRKEYLTVITQPMLITKTPNHDLRLFKKQRQHTETKFTQTNHPRLEYHLHLQSLFILPVVPFKEIRESVIIKMSNHQSSKITFRSRILVQNSNHLIWSFWKRCLQSLSQWKVKWMTRLRVTGYTNLIERGINHLELTLHKIQGLMNTNMNQ